MSEWIPIIVALLSGGVITGLISYFANRSGRRSDAASSNVKTAIMLRDEMVEALRAAQSSREEADSERARADAALTEALERLRYLEGQGIEQLRTDFNAAVKRIDILEAEVVHLRGELRASKMREQQLRNRLNRIRQELGTGPLSGEGDAGEG